VKLTGTPSSVGEGDTESMRAAGFDDADILLVTLIVAYFNFVNRIALGLGVAFDADEVGGYRG
jgi:alkylhydroperoxidase family enzyme